MSKVIFIRHGETEWNTQNRLQGHLNSPLTTNGENQAALLAERLKHYNFNALYSSDLGRAMQTAQYIATACGKAVEIDEELREHNMGIFQGHTRTEMKDKYPAEWAEFNSDRGYEFVIPQGESHQQRYERSARVLNKLAEKHPKETVVVVSHGEVLRDLFEYVLGLAPGSDSKFARKNTSFNVFSKTDSEWVLEVWGDTSHLDSQIV